MTIYIHNLRTGKMPADDPRHVYVGRAIPRLRMSGSPLGNPYRVGNEQEREAAVNRYRLWLFGKPQFPNSATQAELHRLTGLASSGDLHLWCWCAPAACHADVIKTEIELRLRGRRHAD